MFFPHDASSLDSFDLFLLTSTLDINSERRPDRRDDNGGAEASLLATHGAHECG